jgi:LPXTG-motif cell wall-anchored protein
MKKVVGISSKPWLLPVLLGFLLGTAFGLFALGWGLFPVVWVDAIPGQLSASYKEDYLRAAIDSYARNQDTLAAQKRFQGLAEGGPNLLSQITSNPGNLSADDIAKFSAIAVGKTTVTPTTDTPTTANTGKSTIVAMLVGLCLLMLIIGGALIYLLFFRNRASRKKVEEEEPEQGFVNEELDQPNLEQPSPFKPEPMIGKSVPMAVERTVVPDTASVAQFMTSYNLGDDLYDDTFSIDATNGEFLGECGAGISDTIGVGDPKKISAVEVWLFDKNDIQTVTKVIMSSAVYNDPTARQRLSIRGEPVLAEPGKVIRLETATLKMDVRVLDMNYGRGETLPATSFFDRMSLELNIYQK